MQYTVGIKMHIVTESFDYMCYVKKVYYTDTHTKKKNWRSKSILVESGTESVVFWPEKNGPTRQNIMCWLYFILWQQAPI